MELSPRVALPDDAFASKPVPTKARPRRLCLAGAALAHAVFLLALGLAPARPPASETVGPFAVVELISLSGGDGAPSADGQGGPGVKPQAQVKQAAHAEILSSPSRAAPIPPTPPQAPSTRSEPAKSELAPQAQTISPRKTEVRPLRERPPSPQPAPRTIRHEEPAAADPVDPVKTADARDALQPSPPVGPDRLSDARPATGTQARDSRGDAGVSGGQDAGRAEAASGQGGGSGQGQGAERSSGGQGQDVGRSSGGQGEGVGRPAGEGAVYSLGQVDRKPAPIGTVEPEYPRDARLRNISGKVVLRFVVDAAGGVRDARVVSVQPAGVFEDSALEAVRKWRFRPGLLDGKVVPTEVVLPIAFNLKS